MAGPVAPANAVRYGASSPIITQASTLRDTLKPANEGDRFSPCAITWNANESGPSQTVYWSGQFITTAPLSRICALWVNNNFCTVDVAFRFLPSGFTLVVPAGTSGLFEVESLGTEFYVMGTGAAAQDFTEFLVYNFVPRLQTIPKSVFNSVVTAANIALATANTQLIAAGIAGIISGLQVLQVGCATNAAGNFADTVQIVDGDGTVIDIGAFQVPINSFQPASFIIKWEGLSVRYNNGLVLQQVAAGPPPAAMVGALDVKVFHRESTRL